MEKSEAVERRPEDVTGCSPVKTEVDLHSSLLEAITLEPKYQPALALPHSTKDCSEISLRMRNGSAHVLRCLKVWYDLPPETFFNAVNIMDRFLTRMRAQPKHLSCIAVSAFHLACQHTSHYLNVSFTVPDRLDLTNISQSKCGPGDVARMERIMVEKLATDFRCQPPVTPLTLLRLLHAAHAHLAAPHLQFTPESSFSSLTSLIHKLEIVACDSAATVYRPSELALALLTLELQSDVLNSSVHQACLVHLYELCKINAGRFEGCRKVVSELMDQYENQRHSPHRQRLVWRLSNRTLRQLRPTDKLKARLPTIEEKQPSPHPIIRARLESSEHCMSEEEMDFDYDEEFPPLPPPSVGVRSPLKSASSSPHKKPPPTFPYPRISRKHGRMV